jgi:hypothetical protein
MRGSSYSNSISNAIEKMVKKMESFKEEVNFLNSIRLGECSGRLDEMEKNRALDARRFSGSLKMIASGESNY